MAVFKFIVGYSDSKDTLKAGKVDTGKMCVLVIEDTFVEASLTANQMVAAIGLEPTSIEEV